jgi:membrane associated rhomboid family serine protease
VVIPIYDNDPLEKSHRAYVTFVLIALNIAIYAVQDAASDNTSTLLLVNFALFPVALSGEAVTGGFMPPSFSLLTYMFLHSGWMHVLLNMLFLWVFADNIEDALGRGRFLAFYLLCGMAGGAAHVLVAPQSNVPLVGASGAIAGVIAAYLMIRPCAKITVLIFGFIPIKLASYGCLIGSSPRSGTSSAWRKRHRGGRMGGLARRRRAHHRCARPACGCSSACGRRTWLWRRAAFRQVIRRTLGAAKSMLQCVDRVWGGP